MIQHHKRLVKLAEFTEFKETLMLVHIVTIQAPRVNSPPQTS